MKYLIALFLFVSPGFACEHLREGQIWSVQSDFALAY